MARTGITLSSFASLLSAVAGTASLAQNCPLGCAGAASAEKNGGYYELRLTGLEPPTDNVHSRTVMKNSDGQREIELRIEDGRVSASINGEEVPQSQIEQRDGAIIIRDHDGREIQKFDVQAHDGGGMRQFNLTGTRPGGGRAFFEGPADGAEVFEIARPGDDDHPPVMLGLTMVAPDESLLEHLDLDADDVVAIDSVIDGLPADQAGLRARDIIIEFDGQRPVTQENLRARLKDHKPGDEIVVKVVRKGGEKDIKVRLEKWDSEKLGEQSRTIQITPKPNGENMELRVLPRIEGHWAPQAPMQLFEGPGGDQRILMFGGPDNDQIRRALEKAIAALEKDGGRGVEQARDAIQQALKSLETGQGGKVDLNWKRFEGGQAAPRAEVRTRVERAPASGNDAGAAAMERLMERLDRLNERLDKIERRLDERNR